MKSRLNVDKAVLYLDELLSNYSDFSESDDSVSNFEPEMNSSDKEPEEEVESSSQDKDLLSNFQSKLIFASNENAEISDLNCLKYVPRQSATTENISLS